VRAASAVAPLPVVPRPQTGERLASWVNRLARLYAMPVEGFLECCGLGCCSVTDLEWRLGGGEGAWLASRTGMTVEALRTLTFAEIAPAARPVIAPRSRYVCPHCPVGLHLKPAALPWNFWCADHNARLRPRAGGRRPQGLLPGQQRLTVRRRIRARGRRQAGRLGAGKGRNGAGRPRAARLPDDAASQILAAVAF